MGCPELSLINGRLFVLLIICGASNWDSSQNIGSNCVFLIVPCVADNRRFRWRIDASFTFIWGSKLDTKDLTISGTARTCFNFPYWQDSIWPTQLCSKSPWWLIWTTSKGSLISRACRTSPGISMWMKNDCLYRTDGAIEIEAGLVGKSLSVMNVIIFDSRRKLCDV